MAQRREDLRAADKDREFVADQLRVALNEGRLTLAEFDERVQLAYASRTYGELDGILDDLPGVATAEASRVVPADAGHPAMTPEPGRRTFVPGWLMPIWGSWLTTTLIVLVIWVATGAGYFWPIWVIGPWGAILLVGTLSRVAGGAGHLAGPEDQARRAGRRAERDRRRADRRRY